MVTWDEVVPQLGQYITLCNAGQSFTQTCFVKLNNELIGESQCKTITITKKKKKISLRQVCGVLFTL